MHYEDLFPTSDIQNSLMKQGKKLNKWLKKKKKKKINERERCSKL